MPTASVDLHTAACDVFARAGMPIRPGDLDRRLKAIAVDAAQEFCRAIERDTELPLSLITDLLTTTAALREVLGMTPTPVNAEVYWGVVPLVGRPAID